MLKSAFVGLIVGLVALGAGAAIVGAGAFSRGAAPQTTGDVAPVSCDSGVLFCAGSASAVGIGGQVVVASTMPPGSRPISGSPGCPGARVVIAKVGGATTTVYADGAGRYSVSGLSAGSYRIQAFWNGRSSANGNLAAQAGHFYTRQITIN